jgi:hypothetical protein
MKNGSKKLLSFLLVLALAMATLGCPNFFAGFRPKVLPKEGSSLVQYGDYIYLIGGYTADGLVSADVYRSSIVSPQGPWVSAGSIPSPRAFSFSFAVGNLIYVAGGEDENGPVDTIYYTYINPTNGNLGFSGGRWESSSRPLPYPVSRAAGLLHDGRIFLFGGTTLENQAYPLLDSIIQARLFQDGQVSHWYLSQETLPTQTVLPGIAAVDNRVYLAGGKNSVKTLDHLTSFKIGKDGMLSERIIEPPLPGSISSPLVVGLGSDLLILGGKTTEGFSTKVWRRIQNGNFQLENSVHAPAMGIYSVRLGGTLYFTGNPDTGDLYDLKMLENMGIPPLAPQAQPGSGLIAATSIKPASISVLGEKNSAIRYRISSVSEDFPDSLDESDTLYSGTLKISTPSRLTLQAFSADGEKSYPVRREYATKAGGGFATLSGIVPIDEDSGRLQTIFLQEWQYGGTTFPVEYVWYRVTVPPNRAFTRLTLEWADANSSSNQYTGSIHLSMFETDMFSYVLDAEGRAIHKLESLESRSVPLNLQSGEYYLLLESRNGIPPSGDPAYTVGLSISR